jgi:hypothetical protein
MKTRSSFVAICLALVLVLTGQSMAAARGANDATGQMVLCTGTGSVVVYMDESGVPTQAPHFCPDCTLAALTPMIVDSVEVPFFVVITPYFSMAYIAAQSDVEIYAYLSRAPPRLI